MTGALFDTTSCAVPVELQPAALIPVKLYTVLLVGETTTLGVVAPVFQV
jgi:hypothetical protein